MMATANQIYEQPSPAAATVDLLVIVAPAPLDQLEALFLRLSETFAIDSMLIASSDIPSVERFPGLRVTTTTATNSSWTLTPSDFVNAAQLVQQHQPKVILMLGAEASSLTATSLHDLAAAVWNTNVDLAAPHYHLAPHAGLVNSAILYPVSRALFAQAVRFPLAIDLALSPRMVERLAAAAQRYVALKQEDAILWPVSEASTSGYTIAEAEIGPRVLPQPTDSDLNGILARVAGSLFTDIETKAAFWQRARPLPPTRTPLPQAPLQEPAADIGPMLESFRFAYTNLREIWSLVLPPNSLLGLKKLTITDASAFRMPDNLWARIVYDFLLAYRLRTINRGHLLGALTPLYLAWVASHINITATGVSSERHIEAAAAAFEAEKPYLVSRWRWPDRFNP